MQAKAGFNSRSLTLFPSVAAPAEGGGADEPPKRSSRQIKRPSTTARTDHIDDPVRAFPVRIAAETFGAAMRFR